MAVRFLLDTNTVSLHVRRSSATLQRRMQATPAVGVALSVVTEMEIRYGLAKNPALRIAPLVEEFLAGITILPLTSEVAQHYAEMRAALEAKGTPIGPLDLMIAGPRPGRESDAGDHQSRGVPARAWPALRQLGGLTATRRSPAPRNAPSQPVWNMSCHSFPEQCAWQLCASSCNPPNAVLASRTMTRVERILEQALQLPARSRGRLAASLIDSLERRVDLDAEVSWNAEIDRRLAALDAGKAKTVSWHKVEVGLLKRLGARQR